MNSSFQHMLQARHFQLVNQMTRGTWKIIPLCLGWKWTLPGGD